MPRSLIRHTVRTDTGPVVVGAVVEPRLEGTATPLPDAFAAETGGSAVTSFVTNDQGEVIIWVDTWRDQIDLRVSSAAGTHLAGAVGSSFSFAAFTETVAVPAPVGTFVDLASAQTVAGVKTFSDRPVLPGGGYVDLTTAQSIAGIKTFSDRPVLPGGGYVDLTTPQTITAAKTISLGAAGTSVRITREASTFQDGSIEIGRNASSAPASIVFTGGTNRSIAIGVAGSSDHLDVRSWDGTSLLTRLRVRADAPALVMPAVAASSVATDGIGQSFFFDSTTGGPRWRDSSGGLHTISFTNP